MTEELEEIIADLRATEGALVDAREELSNANAMISKLRMDLDESSNKLRALERAVAVGGGRLPGMTDLVLHHERREDQFRTHIERLRGRLATATEIFMNVERALPIGDLRSQVRAFLEGRW